MVLILLLAGLLVVLMVMGVVQALGMIVRLVAGGISRAEPSSTARQLRRLREAGYISAEVYDQVMSGFEAWKANVPPQAAAHFAVRATAQAGPEVSTAPQPAIRPAPEATAGVQFVCRLSPTAPTHGVAAPPSLPRHEVFAAFLERRNIRWGELLGGLLILGCSTALVVSFWGQIADRPIFKFALFTLATAAFFGTGLYSEHRWKLPTTSRAILLMATLLVPVNLLAIAAVGRPGGSSFIAQLASLVIFTGLAWPAARVLVGEWAAILRVGLAATSLSLILITARVISAGIPRLAAMPAGCLLAISAVVAVRLWKLQSIRLAGAIAIYLMLGVIGFTAWLGVGFLLFTAPQMDVAIGALSPIVMAMGLPAIFLGLLIWKRADSADDQRTGISAMAIAIFGMATLLAALASAWPTAGRLVTMSALDALLLTAAAVVFDLPWAYIPAALLATLAWLIGCHSLQAGFSAATDKPDGIFAALRAADNGWLLLPMASLLGLGARLAATMRRPAHSETLGGSALAVTAASVWLANFLNAPHGLAPVLDPAAFDLVVGSVFLVLWASGDGRKWWGMLGTMIPPLLAECVILSWRGTLARGQVFGLLPALSIALCIAIPAALGLVWLRRRVAISGQILAGVGLIETVGVALACRSLASGGDDGALAIFRVGHILTAFAIFGLGVWGRRRYDRLESAEAPVVATVSAQMGMAVLPYRSPANRRWRFPSLTAIGIVEQTVQWSIAIGILAFITCLMSRDQLLSAAKGCRRSACLRDAWHAGRTCRCCCLSVARCSMLPAHLRCDRRRCGRLWISGSFPRPTWSY